MYNSKVDLIDKDEGELNAGKRLLSRAINRHKGFIDIVTYDALACNSKFINLCIELEVDAVVRVKKNRNNSLKQIKKATNKKGITETWQEEMYQIEIYESEFYMTGIDQPLRYIKYAKKENTKERLQILIVTTCLEISLKTLYKIMKARWVIENSIFNNLKTIIFMKPETMRKHGDLMQQYE